MARSIFDAASFRQLAQMARVARRYGTMFAARGEFLQGIRARRIEQSVNRPPVTGRRYQERFVDKTFHCALDFRAVNSPFVHHDERRFQREVPDEDRDAPQHDSFDLRKVIVAPVQRCFERLMPRRCGSATELQEIKMRTQLFHRIPDAKDSGPAGGKLDGECNAVKLAANLGNHGSFVVSKRKLTAASTDTLGEQPYGRIGNHL